MFSSEEASLLSEVYIMLYSGERVLNIPLAYEYFNQIEVLGEHLTSEKCKGSVSSCVSAFWAMVGGLILNK